MKPTKIPIEKEALPDSVQSLEECYFCEKETRYWHVKTNQPVCPRCSRNHTEDELIPSYLDYCSVYYNKVKGECTK